MLIKLRSTILACIVLMLGSASALADQASDREAINALMWHYARALDTFNPEAYAAVYTEDGQFGSANNATKGRQALKEMIVGLRDGRKQRSDSGEAVPAMYHMTTDSWIEFVDDSHALHHSYWLTMYGAAGDNPASMAAVGRGVDEVVKVNGKWLIKSRNVAPADDE